MDKIHHPHNDALVVTLQITNFDIKRILIDQGSSFEIMYTGLFHKLRLKEEDLKPPNNPLVGFSGKIVRSKGKKTLPVWVGLVWPMTKFLVLKADSTYNAIMGRTWHHEKRAIPSTYHQNLRFPIEGGIFDVHEN